MKEPKLGSNKIQSFIDFFTTLGDVRFGLEGLKLFYQKKGEATNYITDASGDIVATGLADDSVSTAKIQDDAVTTAKILDDAVTTAKILDANVTAAKLAASLDLEGKTITNLTANGITASNLSIESGTPVNAVAANKVLTVSGVPVDNDTVTLDTTVYTFQIAIDPAGIAASMTLDVSGLFLAAETVVINTTTYASVATLTEAKGDATLTTGIVVDTETITINSRVYEFDSDSSITGDVAIDISGGTKVQAAENLTLTGVCIEGETFTVGTEVYEIDANGSIDGGSNYAIDVSAFMTASQGTLTLGGAIPLNNETITVGSQEYTWKTTLTGAADEIKIGLTVDDCIDNFVYAINAGIGEGVLYGTGTTANALATAAKTGGTTAVLTNIIYGTIGDSTATTETMVDGANIFDAGTLGTTTAGVDCTAANADGQIVTDFNINTALDITASQGAGTTIDFDCDAAGTQDGSVGNTVALDETMTNGNWVAGAVFMSGGSDATANEASAALHAAIAGDGSAEVSSADGVGSVVVTALIIGTAGNYVTAEATANCTWDGNLVGGLDAVINEVVIGGSAELCIDALVAAATGAAGEGTTYSTGTEQPTGVIVTKQDAATLLATASAVGDAGNTIPIAETQTNAAWTGGAVFLAGGEGAEVAYDVLIGTTAEECIDNLVAAITGGDGEGVVYGTGTVTHTTVTAVKATAATIFASAIIKGVTGNSIDIAENATNIAWADAAILLSGGVDGTVGVARKILVDTTNMYIAITTNTIADANWRKLVPEDGGIAHLGKVGPITIKKTIGGVGVAGCDFNFVTAANQDEQPIDLGAIIPARARVMDIFAVTDQTFTGAVSMNIDIGNATGGAQFIVSADVIAIGTVLPAAVNSAPLVAPNILASNVWVNGTPGANWSLNTAGKITVYITYNDVTNV